MRAWLNLVGWLLLAALLALLGVWLGREPGQVQVQWLGHRVDTSMAFLIIATAAVVLLLWLLDGLFRRFPRNWRRGRADALRGSFRRGMIALAEGRAVLARKLLLKASTLPEQRPLALYGAALAAQQCADPALADELLGSLGKSPLSSPARTAYARAQLNGGHAQAAEVALADLDVPAERMVWIDALRAQGRSSEVLARWSEVLALKSPDKHAISRLQQSLFESALQGVRSREELEALWNHLDRETREQPRCLTAFASTALRVNAAELALDPVQHALQREAIPSLFALYGQLPHPDLRAALQRVEGWRENHTGPELDLALAQLCRRLALWGKAHEVLTAALLKHATPALWEELGEWAFAQSEFKLAAQALRNMASSGRGEPTIAVDLPARSGAPAAGATSDLAAAKEERGVYGFPLPPGG